MVATKENVYVLTDEDTDYINAMADFYGIDSGEAYQRFLLGELGTIDVIVSDIDDDEIDD